MKQVPRNSNWTLSHITIVSSTYVCRSFNNRPMMAARIVGISARKRRVIAVKVKSLDRGVWIHPVATERLGLRLPEQPRARQQTTVHLRLVGVKDTPPPPLCHEPNSTSQLLLRQRASLLGASGEGWRLQVRRHSVLLTLWQGSTSRQQTPTQGLFQLCLFYDWKRKIHVQ